MAQQQQRNKNRSGDWKKKLGLSEPPEGGGGGNSGGGGDTLDAIDELRTQRDEADPYEADALQADYENALKGYEDEVMMMTGDELLAELAKTRERGLADAERIVRAEMRRKGVKEGETPQAERPKAEKPAAQPQATEPRAEKPAEAGETATEPRHGDQKEKKPAVEKPAEDDGPTGLLGSDLDYWVEHLGGAAGAFNSLMKKAGLKVRLYEGDPGENGYVQNGTVYINRKAKGGDPVSFAMGHELTHRMRQANDKAGKRAFSDYKRAALKYLKKELGSEGLEKEYEAYKKRYLKGDETFREKMKDKAFAESGWRDYIEEEMVCDIAGDMLMSPERARQLLLGSGNITTMRRVKDTIQNWIRDALDRLPSKSVKDPANIKKLRKAWKDTYDALERAYAETVKAHEAEKARLGLNSEKRASKIQGLEHRSEAYIEDEVRGYIDDVLGDLGSDIKITGVKVIGSRAEGRAREDSDLDVLVEYEGNAREDDLFNALNGEDNKLVIDGIPVDINPITPGKSGSIAEFMERNAGFEKGGDAYEGERRYSFSKTKEEFDRTRARAVNENGIVMPGLADKTVKIVHAQPHNFAGVSPIKQAEDWAKENIVGVHTLTDNEGNQHDYTISRNAVGKFLSQSATRKSDSLAAHLSVLRHLPEVIAESIEAEVHPDYLRGDDGRRHTELATNNDRLVHRFYGAVEIGGKTYRVKTTINESRGDETNKPHSYEVTKIELIDGNTINQFQEPISPHDVPTIGVAKLLQGVEKSYDSGKKLLEESEKSAKTTGNGSGGEGVRGDASQNETTSADGRRHYSLNGGARRWWGEREEALRSEYDALAEQARPLRRARQEGTAYSPNELAAIDRQMRALRGKIDLVNKVNDLLDNAAARPFWGRAAYLLSVNCYL